MDEWKLEFGGERPGQVGDLMREIVDVRMSAQMSDTQRATAAWFRANGDRERAHTTGVFLKKPRVAGAAPVMGVYVDTHAMATDFGVNKDLYLARLANIGCEVSGIEFIPSKDFIREVCTNRLGFRCVEGPVGNSQMHDPKAMDEALRRSLQQGFTTVKIFRICSGLKRDSAQKYLDSLTKGEHPRLRSVKNGKSYLYFPIQEESPVEK